MAYYGIKNSKKNNDVSLYISKIIGVVFGCAGFFLLFALPSFKVTDPSWFYCSSDTQHIGNVMGILGAYIAAACFYFFGSLSYMLIPLCFYVSHCALFEKYNQEYDRLWVAPCALLTLCLMFYFYGFESDVIFSQGGYCGRALYLFLSQWLDHFLIALVIHAALISEFLILTRTSLIMGAYKVHAAIQFLIDYRHVWLMPIVHIVYSCLQFLTVSVFKMVHAFWNFLFIKKEKLASSDQYEPAYQDAIERCKSSEYINKDISKNKKDDIQHSVVTDNFLNESSRYIVPGISVFSPSEKVQQSHVTSEHAHMAKVLEEKLSRFGVAGMVSKIKPGPVVTLFEYQPDIDSKVSKILALEHDLALALEAMSVRIIAPIPGTSKVGFEVSNKVRKSVKMGDIVRSQAFSHSKAHLPLVLGQDTSGENVVVDLIDMPHLLVAGSTGSGKSIALNAMLASLLCKLSPDQLKLIIIDPKRLEFAAYHDIAHLLFPVITDARKAAPVTQWLVKTMEDRYELMAQEGVRNILDYKKMCKENNKKDHLPFIVLMIDELADLMMVAGKDIEGNIARLAQMARAAGIHLIVATQRPSVDVITGIIKVNFPSRISFRVSSKIDSRTILDAGGAELLLGKGDMLFMDAQSARLARVHGAYVSDKEIADLVKHIHQQSKVDYVDLQEALALYQSKQQTQEENDPLLQDVMLFIADIDEISISLLQRKFKIGYNRSARLIELLEMQGKIMPSIGGKMRRVVK